MTDQEIKLAQESIVDSYTTKSIKLGDHFHNHIIKQLYNYISLIQPDQVGENRAIYEQLLREIGPDILELGRADLALVTETLLEVAQVTQKLTNKRLKVQPTDLDPALVTKILTRTINGKTYADRIWTHKLVLAEHLRKNLHSYVIDKSISLTTLEKQIAYRCRVDRSVARRLVRHEASTVEAQVKHATYLASPAIENLEFITMDDEFVTEDICRPLHGRVFHKADPALPIPPLHIGCRSILRPKYSKMDTYKFTKD